MMKQDISRGKPTKTLQCSVLYSSVSFLTILLGYKPALSQQITPVPPVSVTAPIPAIPTEGSEAAGYKPDTVSNLGPLGQTPVLNTPYSVNVIPAPLIENIQASRPDDLYAIDPAIKMYTTTIRGQAANFALRGFTFANGQGVAEDGMITQNLFNVPLEDKERLEVYTGLTSFLYGPTNVGGLLNWVYKRPTDQPIANLTVGDYGGLSGYAHGDFGGPVKIPGVQDGLFAYRLNIVGQDGATAVDNQSIKRDLISGAFTWNIYPGATLTILGSHADETIHGVDAFWNFPKNPDGSSKVFHPDAPNPDQYFGQPFTTYSEQRDRIGADFSWKLNEIFTARASYAYSKLTVSPYEYANNNISAANGTYSQSVTENSYTNYFANTGYLFIDANFDTSFIHHKLTTGFYGNDYRYAYAPTSYPSITYTGLNFIIPTYFNNPMLVNPNNGPVRTATYTDAKNFVLGDEIKFNEYVSTLIGGNYTILHGDNINNTTGVLTSAYDQGRLSPSASLIIKPISWISTYATYSESLQPGAIVANSGSTIYTNNGTTLSPYTGREYEVGAKANVVGGMLLTASLFQLTQANQYASYNNNGTYTYVQNGQTKVDGVELTATGNVFEGLRIFGGLTLLDPRVTQSQSSATNPSINGLRPTNISNQLEKITAEYDLPFVKGLTLTGGFYFTGPQAVDTRNTEFLPGYATENLGFRFRTTDLLGQKLPLGQEFILRFNVSNIANKAYWLTPNYVGQPRTFTASAEMKF